VVGHALRVRLPRVRHSTGMSLWALLDALGRALVAPISLALILTPPHARCADCWAAHLPPIYRWGWTNALDDVVFRVEHVGVLMRWR
jgi:hypothetical protein